MTAINTNNQIVKFDYPIKDLQENVQLKQKELSHELDSTPLKREIYCGKNEVVAREPLKLDKESIVGLQERKKNVSENDFKTIRYEKKVVLKNIIFVHILIFFLSLGIKIMSFFYKSLQNLLRLLAVQK